MNYLELQDIINSVGRTDFFSLEDKKKEKLLSSEGSLDSTQINNERIPLPTKEGYVFINPKDIIRCSVNKKKSVCFFRNNVKQELTLSLKQTYETLKKYGFLRVHHAHLINIIHIDKYTKERKGGGLITMSSGEIINVSKRKRADFINYLKKT